ncbi:MAG: beta-lactamase family protein [bacterium]|nr:MAG: beta-lactamase family protein [bacterium]
MKTISSNKKMFYVTLFSLVASSLFAQQSPLRISEPVDSVIAELKDYIAERMHEANIRGLAIALIKDGKVAWTGGFGVANTITRKPIASNSKVVTAYATLQLVQQGKLDLDALAHSYLPEPILKPSEYSNKITIRHLLSHSSGLPHQPFSKNVPMFEPGTAYSYSGHGFEYLQKIIELVTRQSLEQVCQQLVFEPLEMGSSSFINKPALRSRTANGHIRSIVPLIVFIIPFIIIYIVTFLIGLVVFRIVLGKWRPTGKFMIIILLIALGLFFVPTYFLFKSLIPEFWWLIVQCIVMFFAAWMVLFLIARLIISRISVLKQRIRIVAGIKIVWGILAFVALIFLESRITNLPVPKWTPVEVHAAGTMRTTVGDLSKFLLELANPQYLSREMATQLHTPQISPNEDISWGLGIGIQHSQYGDVLWQWGQTLDFQSVMVIYPEHNFGVVVFSNSDFFRPLIVFDVAHRALGGKFDGILKAARLEFNR